MGFNSGFKGLNDEQNCWTPEEPYMVGLKKEALNKSTRHLPSNNKTSRDNIKMEVQKVG